MMTKFRLSCMAVASVLAGTSASPARGDYLAFNLYQLHDSQGIDLYGGFTNVRQFPFGPVASSGQIVSHDNQYAMTVWSPTATGGTSLRLSPQSGGAVYATRGGQQAGEVWSNDHPSHASIWSGSRGSLLDLHPAAYYDSEALGTNGRQQVGIGEITLSNDRALLWNGSAGSAVDLHPLNFSISRAYGTDGVHQVGSGRLTGDNYSTAPLHALLWSGSAVSAVDLHPSNFFQTEALAVYGDTAVGNGFANSTYHALLWHGTASSTVDLNPTWATRSEAVSTNGAQQVGYGTDRASGRRHATLWGDTAASAIDLHARLGEGWINSEADSIDKSGNIYGVAEDSAHHIHAVEWTARPAPKVAYVVGRSQQTLLFTNALHFAEFGDPVPASSEPQVGLVFTLSGTVTATDAAGHVRTLARGDKVYLNEHIESINGGVAQLNVQINNGSPLNFDPYVVQSGEPLTLDRHVYDPSKPEDFNNYSLIQKLLFYTSRAVHTNEPEPGAGILGIRGDASDYTDIDKSTLRKAAVVSMGSPVKLFAAVSTPSDAFQLSFEYAFFDASQTLSVTIDGHEIFSTITSTGDVGVVHEASVSVADLAILGLSTAELAFHFDGDHATNAMITNILMPTLYNGDFHDADGNWFAASTDGSVEWAAIALPEPASALGLIAIALTTRRCRARGV